MHRPSTVPWSSRCLATPARQRRCRDNGTTSERALHKCAHGHGDRPEARQERVLHPHVSSPPKLARLGPRVAEAAGVSLGEGERVDLLPLDARDGRHHKLRDAHTTLNEERRGAVVDDQNLDLTAVVAVYRARRVEYRSRHA